MTLPVDSLPANVRPQVPCLSSADAERIAADNFGVRGSATHLDSHIDQNFRVQPADGAPAWVLKIAHSAEDAALLALQQELLAHLHTALPGVTPDLRRSLGGSVSSTIEGPDGQRHQAWMLAYLEGPLLADVKLRDVGTWQALGGLLARLGDAMDALPLTPAAVQASRRPSRWNLANSHWTVGQLPTHIAAERRALLVRAQSQYLADVHGRLDALPQGLTHHDANDHNLIAANSTGPARVQHIFDFGDLRSGARVLELAVAGAYAVLDSAEPLDVLAELAAGYDELRPLEDGELEVLFPALCMRLVVSAVVALQDAALEPENEYLGVHQDALWISLERLLEIAPNDALQTLRKRLGRALLEDQPLARERSLELRQKHVGPSLSLSYDEPLEIERGRGTRLFDKQGRAYLDCVNNVCHVGHCHPHVVAAAQAQIAKLNTNTRYLSDGLGQYAERLAGLFPDPLEVVYLVNSGSEANELALRIARAATGRRDIIAVESGYHGNTGNLIDIGHYKHAGSGGAGAPDWVHIVPLPDPYRGRYRAESDDPLQVSGDAELGARYAAHVAEAAASCSPAAFLAEPLIGCGGQVVPPPGWLSGAYAHARAAGAVCIADEVQVGFGRVGSHMWAFEAQGALPDIVTLGKPIGNGHPMAAVVTTRALAEAFDNGMEYFATFGGNPVSCAVGMAVLDVIEDEGLQAQAARVGEQLVQGFRKLAAEHPAFRGRLGTVRGQGLYLGIEVVKDPHTREPDAAALTSILEQARAQGILLSADGPDHNVMKVKPPLVFDEIDARLLLDVLAGIDQLPLCRPE
ncbi:MAG: 4-aminobutyrate aminotransferase-like enzyme/Ser/Thr protein kinase RdoA (MazF antagonist) [Planctomycetota bacterium]|jgi:4-aminobutyrate aminotransferase-like enzyme/Ser/Thr protein kinase RdoA (MazF antagonist)